MPGALSPILDVLGLEVRATAEIPADVHEPWIVELPTTRDRHWISTHQASVWLRFAASPADRAAGCPAEIDVELRRGDVALIRTDAVVTVATRWNATEPPPDPRDNDVFRFLGVEPASGVLHGTVALGAPRSLGPLADEVLALPDLHIAREWHGHGAVVVPAAEMLSRALLVGRTAEADAIARTIVVATLGTWSPPWLRDNSLRRAIHHVLAAPTRPSLEDLPRPGKTTVRTLQRRFRATTGLWPSEFALWWLSVRARAATTRGDDEDAVAAALGYRDRHSLRRMLRAHRARPNVAEPPGDRFLFR